MCAWVCVMCTIWSQDGGLLTQLELILTHLECAKAKPPKSSPFSHQSSVFVSGGAQEGPKSAFLWHKKSLENAVKYRVWGPDAPPPKNDRKNMFSITHGFTIIKLHFGGSRSPTFSICWSFCLVVFSELIFAFVLGNVEFYLKNKGLSGPRACSVYIIF